MSTSPTPGGLTRSQIIDIAKRRTENRATNLDTASEVVLAIQELCLERRWWWRRKILPFTFKANQSIYQLFDPASVNALDFHQAPRKGFKIYTPTQNLADAVTSLSYPFSWLEPVFDVDQQETIVALQTTFPSARPCRYFITAGGTMYVDPVPDSDYQGSFAYWAVPNLTADDADESIPLVPYAYHGLLIKRLELHMERYCVGEDPAKYQVVAAEYAELLEKAQLYTNFAEGSFREARNLDINDAVQSSH